MNHPQHSRNERRKEIKKFKIWAECFEDAVTCSKALRRNSRFHHFCWGIFSVLIARKSFFSLKLFQDEETSPTHVVKCSEIREWIAVGCNLAGAKRGILFSVESLFHLQTIGADYAVCCGNYLCFISCSIARRREELRNGQASEREECREMQRTSEGEASAKECCCSLIKCSNTW